MAKALDAFRAASQPSFATHTQHCAQPSGTLTHPRAQAAPGARYFRSLQSLFPAALYLCIVIFASARRSKKRRRPRKKGKTPVERSLATAALAAGGAKINGARRRSSFLAYDLAGPQAFETNCPAHWRIFVPSSFFSPCLYGFRLNPRWYSFSGPLHRRAYTGTRESAWA